MILKCEFARYNLVGHDAFAEAEANEVVDAVNDAATLIYPVYKVIYPIIMFIITILYIIQ